MLLSTISGFNLNRKNFINYHTGIITTSNLKIDSNSVDNTQVVAPKIVMNDISNNQDVLENINNDIYFYGAVNMKSCLQLKDYLLDLNLKAKIFRAQYTIDPPPINLHIQSSGGSLLHAFYIIDLIRTLDTPVYTYIDGFAASAATLISVVGKKRFITKNSLMLIHQLSSSESGKYNELKDEMTNFDTMMNNIRNIYLDNSKLENTQLEELLSHDLWLNSNTALKYGLVDEIL